MFKLWTKKQRHAIAAGALLMFAYGITSTALGYMVAPVTEGLGCSRTSFNLYYTIMAIVSFLVAPLYGQLLLKVSIRKILVCGSVIGAACFTAFSFCRVIPAFYVVAFFLGMVQTGCTSMSAVVLINRSFSSGGGSATGLAMAGTGVCSVVMSLILPSFIGAFGWSSAYRLQAAAWAAAMLLACALVKDESTESTASERAGQEEQKVKGVTYRAALKSPSLYIFMICVVVINMMMMFLQHMPAFFGEMGVTPAIAGTIMSVFSIFLIICKISLGGLFDKLGPIKTTGIAISSFALSMWVMSLGILPMLYLGAAMAAFGMSSSTVLVPLITKHIFGSREYAPIWSMISMATSLGAALGSPSWGLIFDTMGTYRMAVMIAPVLVFVDLFILVILMRRKLW